MMLAYRTTWVVRQGCMGKALELFKRDVPRLELAYDAIRVYTPKISPNVLVFEMTFESVEEHDKWWAEFNATANYDEWNALVKRRVGDEVWNLAEWR